jgi:hypothetical protein
MVNYLALIRKHLADGEQGKAYGVLSSKISSVLLSGKRDRHVDAAQLISIAHDDGLIGDTPHQISFQKAGALLDQVASRASFDNNMHAAKTIREFRPWIPIAPKPKKVEMPTVQTGKPLFDSDLLQLKNPKSREGSFTSRLPVIPSKVRLTAPHSVGLFNALPAINTRGSIVSRVEIRREEAVKLVRDSASAPLRRKKREMQRLNEEYQKRKRRETRTRDEARIREEIRKRM